MAQLEVLGPEQCWKLLEQHELARLGYLLNGQVHVMPINYGVDQRSLVFATAPGSKLEAVLTGHELTLEIDQVVNEVGSSVIVRGRGQVVPPAQVVELTQVRVRPWLAPGADVPERDVYVRMSPDEITGRSYQLHRPWTSMLR